MMKKRVIQESDESDEDVPLVKRVKPTESSPHQPYNGNGTHVAAVVKEEPVNGLDSPMAAKRPTSPSSSSDDDDAPLAQHIGKSSASELPANGPGPSKRLSRSDSSDDEEPLAQFKAVLANGDAAKARKRKQKRAQMSDDDDDDSFGGSEGDVKPKKKKKPRSPKEGKSKKHDSKKVETHRERKRSSIPKEESSQVKVETADDEETSRAGSDIEEEKKEWWQSGKEVVGDGSVKWTTLEHNGVLFPPPYEPHGVKMKYDGKPVVLDAEAEEVATFFGSMINTDHAEKEVFRKNFFSDFIDILRDHPPLDGTKITEFDKCDFMPIFEWAEEERAKKKTLTKDQKKQIKEAKEALEEPFKTCLLNKRAEKVGNFRVEPPGLFRGRGAHPKTGMLKRRVRPEQITINIGEDAAMPEPPPGHRWGKIIHDNTVTWLASWNENINGAFKYVFLAAGSSLKGQSDLGKYEKARELKKHIDRIRKDYRNDLTNKVMADRQLATALYLIDLFALRAGNEKGDDEADTVGCCSLRCEHVTLSPPAHVQFDFLGKDSIRYLNDVDVDEQVHKNLRIFKKNKEDVDLLFDRLNTTLLNKHLGGYMKGLSAKVFRTYNASITMQQELEKTDPEDTTADKVLAYNRANRQVAILCNHQKTVSKTHGAAMEKMRDKHRALKYQRMKLRHTLFVIDSSYKKKSAYRDDESDVDDEWIIAHEEDLADKERDKIRKKFEKENEKLKADGEKGLPQTVLDGRLEEVDDNLETLKAERKSKSVEPKRSQTAEKVVAAIEKMDDRIRVHITQTTDKDEGKTTSLGTSKLNYIDPRITFSWCKRFDVPVEKLFAKTLRDKFTWAADADADWRF